MSCRRGPWVLHILPRNQARCSAEGEELLHLGIVIGGVDRRRRQGKERARGAEAAPRRRLGRWRAHA